MATEKQIAANRANAKRSTGPKTAAGRARSSRNAYRHGLSRDLPLDDPAFRTRRDALMQALLEDKEPTEDNMAAALEAAEAHLKLLEIRTLRREMWSNLHQHDWQDVSRLVALDRYERLAHTKRRRATEKLSPIGK